MLHLQTNSQSLAHYLALQEHCLPISTTHYTYSDIPTTPHSFTPTQDFSPTAFDSPTIYQYSESTSPPDSLPPSPLYEENISAQYKPPTPRLRSGNRVPRPRNAFMIFRSEFWAESKISKSVEHDHRHISRIVGHCWNQLPEPEKEVWRQKAEKEKIEHTMKYPGYRFCPNIRTKQVVKRNVKRNGKDELLRCKQVADLLLAGKAGRELDHAVKSIDTSQGRGILAPMDRKNVFNGGLTQQNETPVFRSPLLPPAEAEITSTNQSPARNFNASTSAGTHQTANASSFLDWPLPYPSIPDGQSAPLSTPHYRSLQLEKSATWHTAQGYPHNDHVGGYYTSAQIYDTPRADSNYYTLPDASNQHPRFTNPFGEYAAQNQSMRAEVPNMTPTPVDPLHWGPYPGVQ